MHWTLEPDLDAFAARVRPLLEARIENNVVATVLSGAVEGQFRAAVPVLAVGQDERGDVAAAAMRTAPWPMLCTALAPDEAEALLDVWLERVLREHYFSRRTKPTAQRLREFSDIYFGEHGGYAQQYLFHHARVSSRESKARTE